MNALIVAKFSNFLIKYNLSKTFFLNYAFKKILESLIIELF